mmetsp:Transcript_814/g.1451  ORF Transcript_814/g.1451 Transcript_814/m.1451 type:complete len:93 (-) Transcript_814:220-498(-)
MDMEDQEGNSQFKTVKESELSDSVSISRNDEASQRDFEEEKVPHNNISKTRIGDNDRSSVEHMSRVVDQSVEDDPKGMFTDGMEGKRGRNAY